MAPQYTVEYNRQKHMGGTEAQNFHKPAPNAQNKNAYVVRNNKNNTHIWPTNKNI